MGCILGNHIDRCQILQPGQRSWDKNITGPVAEIVRIFKEYNMIEHINSFIEILIVMSKSEWKKIVYDKVKDKENKEWTATSLLYRGLNDFKSTGINLDRMSLVRGC